MPGHDEEEADSDLEPFDTFDPRAELPEAMRYGEAPGSRRGGAKGQLAQYKYFKKMEYIERMAKKAERKAAFSRQAQRGATRSNDAVFSPNDDDVDDDDDDDDVLKVYRAKRLRELKRDAGKPLFGHMRKEVTKEEYAAAISVDARVVVCVHLTEPTFPSCRRLEHLLETIAGQRPDISFLSMTLRESEQVFEPDLLPLLVFYRNADVVDTQFRVTLSFDPLNELCELHELIDNSTALQHQEHNNNNNKMTTQLYKNKNKKIYNSAAADDDDDAPTGFLATHRPLFASYDAGDDDDDDDDFQ